MTERTDPIGAAGLVDRQVRSGTRDGDPTKTVVAQRRYRAEREDVWQALTDPERLPRWFLPVAGDLSVGGRYQIEGNAGGVIERCDAPRLLAVTWEYAGQVSWVEVELTEAGGHTVLELRHEAIVDPGFWDQFGPGAVGAGWDLSLYALELHLATGESLDPDEAEAWTTGPDGIAFVRAAGEDWARAAVADGEAPEQAGAAAERTIAFFTVPPER